MGDDGMKELRRALGAKPPKALATLDDAQLADLAAALGDARRRQREALQSSADGALKIVPRLLRGPVRKALGM